MIDKIKVKNDWILVVRDETELEKNGFLIPEPSQKKPNTGKIIGVGNLVLDKTIRKGQTAVFVQKAGFEIDIFDITITVLPSEKVLMCI